VIISYPDTFALAGATTGNPVYTHAGGNHIYTFNASGSFTFAS
jgi:hypothetical protein